MKHFYANGRGMFFCQLLSILLIFSFNMFGYAQQPGTVLEGEVHSAIDGRSLEGSTIKVKGGKETAVANNKGYFSLRTNKDKGVLVVSHLGYETKEVAFEGNSSTLAVGLSPTENILEEVDVVSTGYQKIPKERATGSFEFVDNKLLNKRVGTNIMDRLENASVSTRFNKDFQFADKTHYATKVYSYNFDIRGKSIMQGKGGTTIVIDDVVYEGDFRNINPNDIENVTVLKDAVATSIWGTNAGGGVIVLTTKKGKYNSPFQLTFNSNLTLMERPDLYSRPFMNSNDFIDYETYLFNKGYFNSKLNDKRSYPTLSPVVELLDQVKKGNLHQTDADKEIARYKTFDVRDNYSKYIYRPSVSQQYALNLNGGNAALAYNISVAHNADKNQIVVTDLGRTTVRSAVKSRPMKNVEMNADVTYVHTKSNSFSTNSPIDYLSGISGGNGSAWSYLRLVDDDENPININTVPYRRSFRDTAGNGKLLDWNYNPLKELNTNQLTAVQKDILLNTGLKYQINRDFNVQFRYSYQNLVEDISDWGGIKSFAVRNLINVYTQWNDEKILNRPIPVGDRLYTTGMNTISQIGGAQINYSYEDTEKAHSLILMAAGEIKQRRYQMNSSLAYGYDPNTLNHIPVNYTGGYPTLNRQTGGSRIADGIDFDNQTNRYLSVFGNANYTYRQRYMVSASVRQDASNLFGVNTNNKWQPLWSAGLGWLINQETFLNADWLSLFKLRASYGFGGRANQGYSGLPIIYYRGVDNLTGLPYANLSSPPNPSLRWEKFGTLNGGVDLSFRNNRLDLSFEWYKRKSTDLISSALLDPSTGYDAMTKNGGELMAKGFELTISSTNLKSKNFSWKSRLLLSRNRTKVSKYDYKYPSPNYYVQPSGSTNSMLLEGHDAGALFAFPFAGLDPQNGDPQGYLNGELSKDYINILYGALDNMVDVGPGDPVFYSSLSNEINYKNFMLTFNLQARWGHYFFRQTFSEPFFTENRIGHPDYGLRWQKPGDEKRTNVPSLSYPINSFRDQFYRSTEALVEKGDNLRLQDINLTYQFQKIKYIKSLSVFAFVKNMNVILWRANKRGIDPEYRDAIPYPMSFSFGLNIGL